MEEKTSSRSKFSSFPYEPYPIQVDFMNALYSALDKGGVAMLESPTGTGKTLSIICSVLQWILDQKEKPKTGCNAQSFSDDEPDWLRDFGRNKDGSRSAGTVSKTVHNHKRRSLAFPDPGKFRGENVRGTPDSDEEFLVEEYASEGEEMDVTRQARGSFSPSDREESGEGDEEERLKVYFCSRTHSQLSQFMSELKKTDFTTHLNVVCLGSRKNFCINDDVLRLGDSTRINEKCLELQKIKNRELSKIKVQNDGRKVRRVKASHGCPMLHKKMLQEQFKIEAFECGVLDVEDLAELGRKIGTCPYYASRSMVRGASLVVLPYQSLLLKTARESLGLSLKNNVIIIDEAHNLVDSITSMHNSLVTHSQLEELHMHLDMYLDRFKNQLGASNKRYILTLMVVTRAFLKILQGNEVVRITRGEKAYDYSLTINELLFSLDIDNINLVKLYQYINSSKIAYKVSGYRDKFVSLNSGSALSYNGDIVNEGSIISGFQALAAFLLSLTNSNMNGRVIISLSNSLGQANGFLKYVMLDGEKLFHERLQQILDQVHAVVLTGGTLQPIEETRERLFPSLSPDRFHFFSCNHIVPQEHILPIIVSKGPTGVSFDFSYKLRSASVMMEELGRLVCNLVGIVPEGIVIFFTSFDYEAQVYDSWKASGILSRIMKKKIVFREPRCNMEVETILEQYRAAVVLSPSVREKAMCNGAILLAIVGGKMSEGINFSDGMGRCVVMVGLPYPSADIELIERIKHIEGLKEPNIESVNYLEDVIQSGLGILRSCKKKGQVYYENLCMKAVNQSIGRVIRHIGDYAAILLVDSRYSYDLSMRGGSHLITKLPPWIRNCLGPVPDNYGEVHRRLVQFFNLKKQRML